MVWDPKTFKKTTLVSGPQPNTSGIPVFDTDVAAQVAKPAIGTMTFSKENNGSIWIYNGTAWKSVALS